MDQFMSGFVVFNNDMLKAEQVVISCKSIDQWYSAATYCNLMMKKYNHPAVNRELGALLRSKEKTLTLDALAD